MRALLLNNLDGWNIFMFAPLHALLQAIKVLNSLSKERILHRWTRRKFSKMTDSFGFNNVPLPRSSP